MRYVFVQRRCKHAARSKVPSEEHRCDRKTSLRRNCSTVMGKLFVTAQVPQPILR